MKKQSYFSWWWIAALLIIAYLILGCSDLSGELEGGKKYTVREGQHDFTPSPAPLPYQAKTVSGWAVLHTSCWYDNLGEDNYDWNKLAGFYRWSDIIKNKNSFQIGWRPDVKIRDVFELVLYENIDGRNVPKESAIYKVNAGQKFYFDFVCLNGKYTLYINGVLIGKQENDVKFGSVGKISAWFGGTSKAPQTMWIYMDF